MKKVSVIVNVYNAEKYLDKCLLSIINQSYKNIEIILVNDGSNDDSLNICKYYFVIDKRIKIINQTNHGLPFSRNVGVANASGDYITFVDCDDWIDSNFIATLVECITDNIGASLCLKFNIFEEIGLSDDFIIDTSNKEIVEGVDIIKLISQRYRMWEVWGKLYKRDLFNNIHFSEGIYYEDINVVPLLLLKAENVCFVPVQLYYYLHRDGNMSSKKGTPDMIIRPAMLTLNTVKKLYNSLIYNELVIFYINLINEKLMNIDSKPYTEDINEFYRSIYDW